MREGYIFPLLCLTVHLLTSSRVKLRIFRGLATPASPFCQGALLPLRRVEAQRQTSPDFPNAKTRPPTRTTAPGRANGRRACTFFRRVLDVLRGEGDGRGLRQKCGHLQSGAQGLGWKPSSCPPFSLSLVKSKVFEEMNMDNVMGQAGEAKCCSCA